MTVSIPNASLIDEVTEQFELHWRADDSELIERLSAGVSDSDRGVLVLELARADIDRRYAAGQIVSIPDYLKRFPQLNESTEAISQLCFEDFRARKRHGLLSSADRWAGFQGIPEQTWFRDFISSAAEFESSSVFQRELPPRQQLSAVEAGDEVAEGTRLGDFELLSLLGQGAFSKVFLARQTSLGARYVALKIVRQPVKEASHLARLQHTGIVPLYSCHQLQGNWILCMPYSGSATLADWLKHEKNPASRTGQSLVDTVHNAQNRVTQPHPSLVSESLSVPDEQTRRSLQQWHHAATQPLQQLSGKSSQEFSLWIFHRLAAALAHAHQRGVVHGDLKPANILIRNDGEPALIDFNLAQQTDLEPRSWRGGTLPYMAPEQLASLMARSAGYACPETDIYAVGVILFELVEGCLPFGGPASTAESDLSLAITNRKRLPLFSKRRLATEGTRAIIHRCLAFNPADRYSSGSQLLEDLDRERDALPLVYASERWISGRLPKLARRYPRTFSAGAIAFVSLALIALMLVGLVRIQERAARLESLETLAEFGRRSDQVFADFLLADSTASTTLTRSGSIADCLDCLLRAAPRTQMNHRSKVSDTPVHAEWNRLSNYLSASDRLQAEQRLLALGFISAYESIQHAEFIATTSPTNHRSSAGIILSMLPEWAMNSRTGRLLHSVRSNSTTTFSDDPGFGGLAAERRAPEKLASIDLNAKDSADLTLSALAMLLQSQPDQSLEILDSTEPPDSLRLIYWMTRGRVLMELNEPRKAVAAFSMALRDAEVSSVYLNRGIAHLKAGAMKDAEHDFSACIRYAPQNAAGYVNRYAVRAALGRHEEALLDLDHAIERQPDSSRLRLIRSRALRQAGKLRAAKSDFDYAMQHRPVSADDWVSVALAKLAMSPEQALADLQTAETLFGANTTILQSMAHVLSEHLRQPDAAIQTLDRLLEAEPKFQKALAGRAVLYGRRNQVEKSLADVKQLENLGTPPNGETLYQMACAVALCSKTQGDLQKTALRYLARAIQKNYGGELLASDPDLDPVRNSSEFQAIQENYLLIAGHEK